MAMDYRTLKMALLADTSKFTSGLGKAQRDTQTFGGKMKGIAKGIGKAFGLAAIAIAGMASKLAMDGLKAYSDFAEVSSKTEVIFGKNAKAMQEWAKTGAVAFGQSRTQALNSAANFAGMGKAAGLHGKELVKFSKKLTVLASDMASFDNTSVQDAIDSIGSGLRGQSEPLRKYRVLLDAATLKSKAMAMGISDGKGPLTQQQKILAAYSEILRQTSDAQGDYGRTSGGLANGQRTLGKLWENAQITIGEGIYPTMTKLVKFLNSPDGQKVITDFAEAFASAIKTMAKYLPGVVAEVSKLVKKVGQQGLMAGLLSDPKVAIAAAAFAAGSIVGGPGAGAIAAIAAYAGAQGIQDYGNNVGNDTAGAAALMSGNQVAQLFAGGGNKKPSKTPKLYSGRPGYFWSSKKKAAQDLADYEAEQSGGGGGAFDKPKSRVDANRLTPNINITINGAADARQSARAIQRTLDKIYANGGSLVGVIDNR
jgi:hypothetical protein